MMHDDTLSKLAEYEEKVGKLQDLATGTARDFSEAMKSLGGSSGDASVQAANQATMTVELKHMQEKLDAMEANLKKATGELEESRLGNLVAKEELGKKKPRRSPERGVATSWITTITCDELGIRQLRS